VDVIVIIMAKPQLVFGGAILAVLLAGCASAKPKTQLAGDPAERYRAADRAKRDRDAARRDAAEEAYWREVDKAAAEHAAAAAEAEAAEQRAKEAADASAEADAAASERPRD
jgi:hypothetical protein